MLQHPVAVVVGQLVMASVGLLRFEGLLDRVILRIGDSQQEVHARVAILPGDLKDILAKPGRTQVQRAAPAADL